MIIKRPDVLKRTGSLWWNENTSQIMRYYEPPFDGYGNAFTCAVWMYPEGAITGNPYLFAAYDTGGATNAWGARLYDWSGNRILVFRPNSRYKVSNTQFSFNTWQHFAYIDRGDPTIAGGGNWTIYLDGSDAGNYTSGSGSSDERHPDYFNMGNRTSTGAEYDGYLAHFACWHRELMPHEIKFLAKGYSPLWFPGATMYLPMTDGEGVDVITGQYPEISRAYITPAGNAPTYKIIQPPWVELPQRFFNFPIGVTATTLTVDNLSQSSTVDKVAVTTTYNATVDNLSQATTLTKLTLTQLHVLSVDNLSQSTAVDKLSLVLESALDVYDLSQSNAVDKLSITQLHNLQVDDLSQSTTVESIILQAQGYLAIYPLSQSNAVDKIGITKQSDIDAYNLAQSTTVDKITFSGGLVNLTVDNLSQATTLTKLGVFTQYAQLIVEHLSNSQTVGHISLTQQHVLQGVSDLSQATTVDKVGVWANNNIDVKNLSNTNTSTKISMTQIHVLVIPGAYVNTTVDNVGLWDWWYEIVEGVGLVTRAPDVVGYITRSHEGYGFIRQTEEQDGLIVQTLEEDGSIVQTYDVEGEIVREYEGIGEI